MAIIGAGSGTSYPAAVDTAQTEVASPSASKTKITAGGTNDERFAILAIETELGTNPRGTASSVKDFLQKEHNVDGTHNISTQQVPINYAEDSGTVNAYILNLTPGILSLIKGVEVKWKVSITNTDASTLKVDSTTAKSIVKGINTPLVAGELPAGAQVTTRFDGTNWVLTSATCAISTAEISPLAGIIGSQLASNAGITGSQLANGTIDNTQLGSGVAIANIGVGGITQTQLGSSSVGTPQLKTATGVTSVFQNTNDVTNVTMNDYSFFPMICQNSSIATMQAVIKADPGTTVGCFRTQALGVGTFTARWRYITASDDPTLWAIHDDSGYIAGVWVSDDPITGNIPGLSMEGFSTIQIPREDLSILVQLASPENVIVGTKIASSPDRISFRILELQFKNIALEIMNRCKIMNSKLALK